MDNNKHNYNTNNNKYRLYTVYEVYMRIYKLEETNIATEREAQSCYGFPRVYKYAYKSNKQYLRYLLNKKNSQ